MPIDVYYALHSPPARAVVVTAKHLNIDVNLKEVDVLGPTSGTHDPNYLKVPNRLNVFIVDNGFTLFESRAILQYFSNAYAPNSTLYPRDAQARATIDKALYYDASALFPSIRGVLLPRIQEKAPPPEAVEDLKEKVHILELILGDSRFFGGEEASIADISIGVSIPILKLLYPSLISPKIQSWYDRTLRDVPALEEYNDKADYKSFLQKTV